MILRSCGQTERLATLTLTVEEGWRSGVDGFAVYRCRVTQIQGRHPIPPQRHKSLCIDTTFGNPNTSTSPASNFSPSLRTIWHVTLEKVKIHFTS